MNLLLMYPNALFPIYKEGQLHAEMSYWSHVYMQLGASFSNLNCNSLHHSAICGFYFVYV